MRMSLSRAAMGALVIVAVLAIGSLGVYAASSTATISLSASAPEKSDANAAAAAIAAEEQRLLPSTAKEVPCAPDRATFPPFTRLSNMTGGFYILTDGSCFTDP